MNKSNLFRVYQYLFPDGYIYIGRTCQTIEARIDGGYTARMEAYLTSHGLVFRTKPYVQYLLDSHTILYDNLSYEEAKRLETKLTDAAKLKYGDKCLNLQCGDNLSDEQKQHLSKIMSGQILPDGTKQKISEAMSGKNHPLYGKHRSDETKQKISESNQGHAVSEETKQKIREANYGHTRSDETRQKMSQNHADFSGANNPKYTLYLISDGINSFEGDQTQIAEHLHLDPSEIHKVKNWICLGFPQRRFPGLKVISKRKPNVK